MDNTYQLHTLAYVNLRKGSGQEIGSVEILTRSKSALTGFLLLTMVCRNYSEKTLRS